MIIIAWNFPQLYPSLNLQTRAVLKAIAPISLLPILSKLLEKHVYGLLSNIYNFLNQFMIHSLVSNEENQLLLLYWKLPITDCNCWRVGGTYIGAIFFDFKKAFDSVPDRALMDKLKATNLNPILLHWIQSYLSGRSQQVHVNGEKSDPLPVLSGVPQGSIIGPLYCS